MPLSLTRAGQRNSAGVRAAAATLLARDASGALAAFHALADRCAFSTNVSADKIAMFDMAGRILDGRTIEQHRAGGDRRAGLRAFRAVQGAYLARRTRFEALWNDGRRLVYGALNAGGMGTEGRYGPFCVVIADPSAPAPAALGVFPADSVARYCSATGVVNRIRALADIVAWPDRGALATIERQPEALAQPPHTWPDVICTPSRYLEAVLAPGPPLATVDAVRVRQTYLDRLEDLSVLGIDGALDPGTALRELVAFEAMNRWRVDHGVAIEGVG